jgi:hypothetical protein
MWWMFGFVMLTWAVPVPALPPDVVPLAREAQELLYNLEFARAGEVLKRINDLHPAHPVGPAMLAAGKWWEARYTSVPPTDEETDAMDRLITRAVDLAKKHAADPATECEGRFFLGGALGVRAHWELLRGNWYRSAMGARGAVNALTPVLSCTEWANEAMFGLGHYEYVAAKLPWSLRWLSRLVVGRPDREGGLRKLEQAAAHSVWIRNDAQATLALILTVFDTEPERGLVHAETFVRERPNSPMAHSLRIQALMFCRRWDAVLAESAAVLARAREPGSTFALESAAYRYFQGMALLGLRQPGEAAAAFSAAAEAAGRPPWITAAILKRGCAKDLLGDRAGAEEDYRKVLALPDPWRQGRRAKSYLKRPFTWDDFLTELSPRSD